MLTLISSLWITASTILPVMVRLRPNQTTKPIGGRDRDQHQIVADVIEACEFDIAEQFVGLRRIDRIDAPDQLGDVLENEKHRIGHQQQHHFVAAIEHLSRPRSSSRPTADAIRATETSIATKPTLGGRLMRGDHGDRGRRDIGAERIEAAMGDVENLQHAEHQRQPQRDDEKPGRLNQPVEHDRQKEVHGVVHGSLPANADEWRAAIVSTP